ncbi:MAG: AzlC family ABC transporter permease [Mycobacteriales bacterium]
MDTTTDTPVPEATETAETTRATVRDAVVLGLAVGVSGLAFGAAGTAAGLSVAQTSVLSFVAFTGGSQFALVGAIAGGGSLAAGVAGAWLLGLRNTLYGVRLARTLAVRGPRRLVAAHGVIDETTAMAVARTSPAQARIAFWSTFATLFVVWNLSTVAGAAGSARLGDPSALGIDAVVPAAFLALLAPRLRDRVQLPVALVGALIALVAVPLAPAGLPVLLAAAAVLVGLRRAT